MLETLNIYLTGQRVRKLAPWESYQLVDEDCLLWYALFSCFSTDFVTTKSAGALSLNFLTSELWKWIYVFISSPVYGIWLQQPKQTKLRLIEILELFYFLRFLEYFERRKRILRWFPGVSDSKESSCNVRDLGLIPGSGRSPGEGNGYPFQYSRLGNPMDRGAWWSTVYRVAKSCTWLSDYRFISL